MAPADRRDGAARRVPGGQSRGGSGETEYSASTRKSALIVALAASFITPFMGSSINVALPEIARTFGIDAVLLGWIATVYLLAAGMTLLPSGRLADIFGRKRVLLIGFAVFTLSSLLCGLAGTAAVLIASRFLQGIGGGMIFATGTAILVSVFPPRERGRVLGITISMVYVGLLSGPFIGGILTTHLTWRSLFFVNALLGALVVGLIFHRLEGEWTGAAGERFDAVGAIVYGAALVCVIYGLSAVPAPKGIRLILAGLAGFAAFAAWERRVAHPVFDLSLFTRNRTFALSNLAALIHYSATFAITFLLSLYLQYVKGFDPQTAGTVLISQPLTMALFSPLMGKLSDRIEPRLLSTAGMTIMCGMLLVLSSIGEKTSLTFIVSCLLVLGFGYAMFSSPNMNAIMGSVEKRHLGLASGAAGTMRILGQVFSMAGATLVLSLYVGHRQITPALYPDLLHSFRVAFIGFAVLSLAGIFASSVRGNLRK